MIDLAVAIPLQGKDILDKCDAPTADVPEPTTLYYLTVIAFLLHVDVEGSCRCAAWCGPAMTCAARTDCGRCFRAMLPVKKEKPVLHVESPKVVYGYFLAEEPDELEIVSWQREIRHFCRTRGLVLANVFVDRGPLGDTVQRPGLGGLLDVLAMPETFGFVVPSEDHLSRSKPALMVLALRISQTPAQIVVMSQHTDDTTARR